MSNENENANEEKPPRLYNVKPRHTNPIKKLKDYKEEKEK